MAPSTSNDGLFFVVGGTVRPNAPSYVEREADDELYAALKRMDFCYVLDMRQMDKKKRLATDWWAPRLGFN
jgi:hypothetical protein